MAASRSPRAAPPLGGVNNADCNDTDVYTFDLFCILNCFGGDFSTCSFEKYDLGPCQGDVDVHLFAIFTVLNAFSDIDPCCAPEAGFHVTGP